MSRPRPATVQRGKLSLFALSVILSSSCVNDKYDLSGNIDKSMTIFENGISFPVGNSDTITMGQLIEIDDEDQIKVDKTTGNYYLYQKQKTENDLSLKIESSAINVGNTEEFVVDVEAENPYHNNPDLPELPEGKFVLPIIGENGSDLSMNSNEIATEILNIKNITTTPTKLRIIVKAENLSSYSDKLYFDDDFRINLPADLICQDERIVKEGNKQYLKLGGLHISENTPFYYDLDVYGCYFGESGVDIVDGSIDRQYRINAEGSFYLTSLKKTDEELIKMSVNIATDGLYMNIVSAELKADPTIDPVEDKVDFDLSSMPEFLQGDDIVLNLAHAAIKVDIDGNIPMDVFMSGKFASYKDGSLIEDASFGVTGEQLVLQDNTDNRFLFTSDPAETASGYKTVYVENMNNLFYKLPDQLDFRVDAKADKDNYYTVNLGENNDIQIEYEANIPLKFGKDLAINYAETIDIDLEDENSIETESIMLKGVLTNSIPMNVSISAVPVDEYGEEISGVTIDITPSQLTSGDNELSIVAGSDNGGNILESLKGIKLNLSIENDGTDDIQLNENQYIQLKKVQLRLPEGITIDNN